MEKKIQSKILIRTGSVISSLGALTLAEGVVAQRGELGSLGVFIGGTGAVIVLTGIRKKNKI